MIARPLAACFLLLLSASEVRAERCRTDFARDVALAERQSLPSPRRLHATPGRVVDDVLTLPASLCDDASRCTLQAAGMKDGEPIYDFNNALAAQQIFASGAADGYDELVLFFTFRPTFSGSASYVPVFNDVRGINFAQNSPGGPKVDESLNLRALFGTSGRLRGLVVMGDLFQCARFQKSGAFKGCADLPPFPGIYDSIHGVLAQETAHAFGAYVRYQEGAAASTAMLGRDRAHWSYLLGTGGSPLEGNAWSQQGGTFRLAPTPQVRFSPLDQYLMGVRRAVEVPPFTLITSPSPVANPADPPGSGPQLISGVARRISIDEVIAAEGARLPAFEGAPHLVRQLFVLLTLPGETGLDGPLAAISRIRRHWPGFFYAATGERMRVISTVAGDDDTPLFTFTSGAEDFTASGGTLAWKEGRVELTATADDARVGRGALAIPFAAGSVLRLRISAPAGLLRTARLVLGFDGSQRSTTDFGRLGGTRTWAIALPAAGGTLRSLSLQPAVGYSAARTVALERVEVSAGPAQDRDGDLVEDADDDCPDVANPSQDDLDGDGLGDACDLDRDGDGAPDAVDGCPDDPNPDQISWRFDRRGIPCSPRGPGCGCGAADGHFSALAALAWLGLLGAARRRRHP